MKALSGSIILTALFLGSLPLKAQILADAASPANSSSMSSSADPLPDAPRAQNSNQSQSMYDRIFPSGHIPVILAPRMTDIPLTPHDKWKLYTHQATNPLNIIVIPAGVAGLRMVFPPASYPHEWKSGPDGFGRLYGDSLARIESQNAARFLTGVALQQDPRYLPASTTNPVGRLIHATVYTLIGRSDATLKMPSVANFAGAAASGFVGMAYMPDGFNDVTHAGQRSILAMGSYAGLNIINEFCPEWAPLAKKVHMPFFPAGCIAPSKPKHP